MLHILNLFGRSPFAPLQGHMQRVSDCIYGLEPLFTALSHQEYSLVETYAARISELEHAADLTKNDIRNHLPSSLFMSIDRGNFLEMLATQDSLADRAEDIAVLLTLRKLSFPEALKKPFFAFLQKNIESFEVIRKIIQDLNELLESSFGGPEAEKVRAMVEQVAYKEHEADVLQRTLLKEFFKLEDSLSYGVYGHWERVFEAVGSISNLSEKLANCVRMTLDVK
jgi:predicted phosphate transport protein (TIGR00153 family)